MVVSASRSGAAVPATAPPRVIRVACRALTVSAIVSAAGIVFLVGMFVAFALGARSVGMALGWVNDALVIAQYALTLPAVMVLHRAFRSRWPRASLVTASLGALGIAGVVALQSLLVAGVLTFEQEIGPAGLAYIPLGIWFIASGWLASRSGLDPRGTVFGVLGASYLGFPLWAWRLSDRLQRLPIMEPPRTA
jgi:hypothetical protein